jgi:hypothetical protein
MGCEVNPITWQWVAGFFDAEGFVNVVARPGESRYYLNAIIVQKDKAPIDRIARFFDAHGIGSTIGTRPASPCRPREGVVWRIDIYKRDSLAKFVTAVEPYSTVKAGSVRSTLVMLGMADNRLTSLSKEGREAFDRLAALNKRGRASDDLETAARYPTERPVWFYDWLAGFMDGDGCYHARKNGNPSLSVSQSGARGRVLCEWLRDMLGCGSVNTRTMRRDNNRRENSLEITTTKDIELITARLYGKTVIKCRAAALVWLTAMEWEDNKRDVPFKQFVRKYLAAINQYPNDFAAIKRAERAYRFNAANVLKRAMNWHANRGLLVQALDELAAQNSEPDNCTTDAATLELESWLLGEVEATP